MFRLISEIFDSIFYFIFIVFFGAFCLIVECLSYVICGIFSLIFKNPLMEWIGEILNNFFELLEKIFCSGSNKEYNEPCGQGTYDYDGDCGGDGGGE